jgi:hypothetical protein
MMLTTDGDANDNAATQTTGDDADNGDVATDVNAAMNTTR